MLQARKPLAKKENDEIGSKQQKQKSNQARIYYSTTLDVVGTLIEGINKSKYFQTKPSLKEEKRIERIETQQKKTKTKEISKGRDPEHDLTKALT